MATVVCSRRAASRPGRGFSACLVEVHQGNEFGTAGPTQVRIPDAFRPLRLHRREGRLNCVDNLRDTFVGHLVVNHQDRHGISLVFWLGELLLVCCIHSRRAPDLRPIPASIT
ncbi:hypothetical protein ACFTXM_02140 [Streptomyces sp. NPDC056930]|uniref:hypothetical protein n=1 Tax=Streptomyces sp. NPDC056930 TaxID=3345967 RepID=UPI0036266338